MIGEKIFRAALGLLRAADAHGDGFALVMSYETFEDFAYYLESRSTTPACEEPQAIHWRRKPMLRGVPIIRTKDVEGVRLANWSEVTVELTEPDDPSLLGRDHIVAGDELLNFFALVDTTMIDTEEGRRLRAMALTVARSRLGPSTPPWVIVDMLETHRMWARVYEVILHQFKNGNPALAELDYPDAWEALELARKHVDGARHGNYWIAPDYLMDIFERKPLEKWRERYGEPTT